MVEFASRLNTKMQLPNDQSPIPRGQIVLANTADECEIGSTELADSCTEVDEGADAEAFVVVVLASIAIVIVARIGLRSIAAAGPMPSRKSVRPNVKRW